MVEGIRVRVPAPRPGTHTRPAHRLGGGDRAAYAAQPPGAYATERVMPASHVVPLPDEISFEVAAAAMLQFRYVTLFAMYLQGNTGAAV